MELNFINKPTLFSIPYRLILSIHKIPTNSLQFPIYNLFKFYSTIIVLSSLNAKPFAFSSLYFIGVCPVLCSQKGEYINGECQCNPGWKGKECSLRHDECEVADCNGHGHCVSGKCQCVRGFKGKFCEEGKATIHWNTASSRIKIGCFLRVE